MKKTLILTCIFLFIGLAAFSATVKPKVMWLDCSANWERFSYPDSIKYYVEKCHNAGITDLILDLKGTSGEVLYPSKIAPQKKEWKGFVRPDFDFVNTFIFSARKYNMRIFAAFNIFCEGHGIFRRGIVYDTHKDWQSINYVPGKGLVPLTEIKGKATGFTNPALPEVQEYELSILKEVVQNYTFDGIIIDRARYDGIQSDFSDFSRNLFEKYIGKKLLRFPEDIYEWVADEKGNYNKVNGPFFNQWIEWRASVIYNFFVKARKTVKSTKSNVLFGTYTGAWYPSYYEVGANWASKKYDPSKDFDWATKRYRKYGYADILDVYMNGNYYWNVSLEEYRNSKGVYKNETDSEISKGEHLCVEGGCIYSKKILKGAVPLYGSLYVEDYKKDKEQFKRAIKMTLEKSDGLMIFDVVHIINNNWWNSLAEGMSSVDQ
ncbi:MAG: alpha amylase family protein [Paludibacter sp.]|nr:alpha amylase family protein [Paludibacter sp.]